jgi:hypothetical protein
MHFRCPVLFFALISLDIFHEYPIIGTWIFAFWTPLKTPIAAGRLNLSHLRLAKTLTARQAACVFCQLNLSKIHLVGRRVRF